MSDNETILAGMQDKLAGKSGRLLWKTLDELADTKEFQSWIEDEFPNRADLLNIDRRQFLKVGGAALAMAGLTGCRILPQTKAVPYVRSPEDLVSGQALAYASTLTHNGYGLGVLVEQYEGRPIKIEGNPQHPASLGSTDVFEQAELLNMYDPDRSQSIMHNGEVAGYNELTDMLRKVRGSWAGGLRILTGTVTSPTLTAQINRLLAKHPGSVWHAYDAVNRDSVHEAGTAAFGRPVNPVYNLQEARVIVSLDADFFKTVPGNIRYARDWADGRRVRGASGGAMNRLYVIESSTTTTGASADHRYPVKPSEIETVARALFESVIDGAAATAQPVTWLAEMVADLQAGPGAVVIPGEEASPAVHAYAMAINESLGAVGRTVNYTAPVETSPFGHVSSLTDLVAAMNAGRVNTLVILGGNPVYDAPADLNFADALRKVPNSIQHGLYQDETAALVSWHVPATHALETWGDARAFDGTTSLVQPLIAPIYEGNKSDTELLAELLDEPRYGYDILRETYAPLGGADFEKWWQQTLIDGVVPNTAETPLAGLRVNLPAVAALTAPAPASGIEVNFRPDPHVWDGRYANNSWLMELPRPVTTVTWDNVAVVSPATAQKLGANPTDGSSDAENAARISGKALIEVKVPGIKDGVQLPVWVLPGQPNDVITLSLGFGRTRVGAVGENVGQNVYPLRTSKTMSYANGATTRRVKWKPEGDSLNLVGDATNGNSVDVFGDYRVAATQAQHLMRGIDIKETEDRDIVRHASLAEYKEKAGKVGPEGHHGGGGTTEGHGEEHGGGSEGATHGGAEAQEGAASLPVDPKQGPDIIADKGLPIPGLQGRGNWAYSNRDSAERTITNPEGNVSLYPEFSKSNYNAWAMNIDLTTCIGCNACTIACQAENNIPTVGKEQVGRGRQMHWIRIDHYFSTNAADAIGLKDPAQVESYFMPVACMHCEKAPCEPVCPVAATIHSHEGLNQMIYNRCVGTRYCSNNCPYKVRRFNFLKWTAGWGGKGTLNFFDLPVLKLATNPEVTVRGRGVMEKCSYCTQRINAVRIKAKKEQREIQDGEIVTACQQVCPTNAIIFGDLNDPNSEVSKLKQQPHDYGLLAELNTRPRTTYLAKIRNTNPAIPQLAAAASTKPAHGEGAGH
ncbi:MAG: TAT-variant-translocated molybdopterin oxidoreductase [Fibrella sp.]|nr:TAT-variant-translocated molybdopterin oxidoreductase [Armatimonadota bacterium]